ncbi:MAG: S-adenosylmethionine:tRNA ribosyltransferase-isomerase [Candidatus Hydrogenedentota bacterium]
MRASELDYTLPDDLIAQQPAQKRDASRLLVVNRATGTLHSDVYANVANHLRAGDCLVLNKSKVIRARLHGRKETGGRVEIFLLRELSRGEWECLMRPSAKIKEGSVIHVSETVKAVAGTVLSEGKRVVRFDPPDVLAVLEREGEMPLPPYIRRDSPDPTDLTRYQTIYAESPGSVAAPTAGLHFTPEVFAALDTAGIQRTELTLHVGYGTFKPIQAEDLRNHTLDGEDYEFSPEAAERLNLTRTRGGRVIAVGTTATRVLESQCQNGSFHPGNGTTRLFIYPPYTFQAVDVLQTNFHLPRSSLLALVCAFAGTELTMEAYRYAVRERFRFYSYGDVMLIL